VSRLFIVIFIITSQVSMWSQKRIICVKGDEDNIKYFQWVDDSFFKTKKLYTLSTNRADTTYHIFKFEHTDGWFIENHPDETPKRKVLVSKNHFLLESFWDKSGKQTVTDGNGYVIDTGGCISFTSYVNGRRTNWQTNFDMNGKVMNRVLYKDGLVQKIIIYHETLNQIMRVVEWVPSADDAQFYNCDEFNYHKFGLNHGEQINFFDNGNIKSKEYYSHGEKDSTWYYFHPNGRLKSKHDFRTNQSTFYDSSGYSDNNPLYSKLIEASWFTSQDFNSSKIYLTAYDTKAILGFSQYQFQYDLTCLVYTQLECKSVFSDYLNFIIRDDKIEFQDLEGNIFVYKVKIMRADRIELTKE
jgi:antitoxin component YwqK of YwqJK toxin-antitoxin module